MSSWEEQVKNQSIKVSKWFISSSVTFLQLQSQLQIIPDKNTNKTYLVAGNPKTCLRSISIKTFCELCKAQWMQIWRQSNSKCHGPLFKHLSTFRGFVVSHSKATVALLKYLLTPRAPCYTLLNCPAIYCHKSVDKWHHFHAFASHTCQS